MSLGVWKVWHLRSLQPSKLPLRSMSNTRERRLFSRKSSSRIASGHQGDNMFCDSSTCLLGFTLVFESSSFSDCFFFVKPAGSPTILLSCNFFLTLYSQLSSVNLLICSVVLSKFFFFFFFHSELEFVSTLARLAWLEAKNDAKPHSFFAIPCHWQTQGKTVSLSWNTSAHADSRSSHLRAF